MLKMNNIRWRTWIEADNIGAPGHDELVLDGTIIAVNVLNAAKDFRVHVHRQRIAPRVLQCAVDRNPRLSFLHHHGFLNRSTSILSLPVYIMISQIWRICNSNTMVHACGQKVNPIHVFWKRKRKRRTRGEAYYVSSGTRRKFVDGMRRK